MTFLESIPALLAFLGLLSALVIQILSKRKLYEKLSTSEESRFEALSEATIYRERLQTMEQTHTQLTETFKNISNQALLANNQSFLGLAQNSFEKFMEIAESF